MWFIVNVQVFLKSIGKFERSEEAKIIPIPDRRPTSSCRQTTSEANRSRQGIPDIPSLAVPGIHLVVSGFHLGVSVKGD
jgi:hypothetical protein